MSGGSGGNDNRNQKGDLRYNMYNNNITIHIIMIYTYNII